MKRLADIVVAKTMRGNIVGYFRRVSDNKSVYHYTTLVRGHEDGSPYKDGKIRAKELRFMTEFGSGAYTYEEVR